MKEVWYTGLEYFIIYDGAESEMERETLRPILMYNETWHERAPHRPTESGLMRQVVV